MVQRASKLIAEDESGTATAGGGTIAFEDASLVERCRRGDLRAFEALVAKYQDRVYNLILRMVSRAADAEELAQETFLKALENLGQFRGSSGFYTWLFRIAANLAISHRRRSQRVRFRPLEGAEGDGQADALIAEMSAAKTPLPDAPSMSRELAQRVAEALEELDDEFRLVVVLRDIEDMDYSEIAEVLDAPVGTVKSRLHRARLMLKDKLADLMDE